jgi:cytochrome b561
MIAPTENGKLMLVKNSSTRFGLVAVTLHWLIALLFLFMIGLGLVMTRLPITDPWTFPLFQLHKSVGVTIFALVAFRIAWRGGNAAPPLPGNLKPYERALAHLTHYGLYAALVLMPLTGWITVSASPLGIPTLLYGVIPLPHIGFIAARPDKEAIESVAGWVHTILAWSALALVCLHFAAALKHHFILRDDVLRRMLPSRALFQRKPRT